VHQARVGTGAASVVIPGQALAGPELAPGKLDVGLLTQMSGTVNAAARAMFKGVPAVAVSTAIDMALFMRDRQAGYLKPLNAMGDSRCPARPWHRRRESRKTDRSD